MTDISKIAGQLPGFDPTKLGTERAPQGASFGEVLGGFLKDVNELRFDADESIKGLVTGEIADVHQVMIAAAKADIAFALMMKIRGKLLKAYEEVIKMGV